MSMANLNISREFLHVENEKSIFFLHLFHFFSFSDNTIEFGGAKAIAEALKVSMSMANLNISREFLHVENEKSIFFLHLFHFFSFSDNTIEFGGAKAIAEALKISVSITSLNLTGGTEEIQSIL
eukprot:TRINITY_DN2433_c1_g1_i2.p1 TRINITY_DN2433_c1_g1~~TRINITY_DN2433_c1_g1_i2.p1  ORF type:complete len:133 (-),score=42.70 TRINITY_DN2433_c1_g1_i2:57-428(-)